MMLVLPTGVDWPYWATAKSAETAEYEHKQTAQSAALVVTHFELSGNKVCCFLLP